VSVAAASAASQASPLAPYVTRVPDRDQKRACGHHAEDPADTGRQRRKHGSIIDGRERRLDRFVATAVNPAESLEVHRPRQPEPCDLEHKTVRASARRRARNALRVTFTTSSTTVCDASYCACGVVVSESKPDSAEEGGGAACDRRGCRGGGERHGRGGRRRSRGSRRGSPYPLAEPGVGEHAVGGTNLGGERPKQAR